MGSQVLTTVLPWLCLRWSGQSTVCGKIITDVLVIDRVWQDHHGCARDHSRGSDGAY